VGESVCVLVLLCVRGVEGEREREREGKVRGKNRVVKPRISKSEHHRGTSRRRRGKFD